MKSTQRVRFKQSDIYQAIEFASPLGRVTFNKGYLYYSADINNGKSVKHISSCRPNDLISRLNSLIENNKKEQL